MIIDLSHPLAPGMPSYPGLPEPRFHVFLAHEDAPRQAHYSPGTTFQIAAYELAGNLTASASEHLAHSGAALVGIDCANIDSMKDPARPAHTLLLAAGIPIVEHLRGLEQLHGRSLRFFSAPPAIRGGTSFPVRAFAVCD
jgi:kynurenine formamidase